MEVLSDRIIWDKDDFLAGMVPSQLANSTRIFGVRGSSFHRDCDPLFGTIPGCLYPGGTPTNYTDVDADSPATILVSAVNSPTDAYAYALGTGTVEQINLSSDALIVAGGTFPHAITPHGHANLTAALGDMAVYNVSGTKKIFYSWNDGTDWDVGVFDLSTTFDDDFMSTVPATPLGTVAADLTGGQGKAHPLYVSKDGILYIGSANYVHAYDGVSNSFVSQNLDLPTAYEVVGFAETDSDLIVFATTGRGTGRRATATAFFWDQSRPESYYRAVDLEDDDVACPFGYQNTVGCFTRNRNRNGNATVRIWNGSRFVPLWQYTSPSGTSYLPGVKGAIVMDNMIYFNAAGGLFAVGSLYGQYPSGKFWLNTGSGSTAGGFLVSFGGGTLTMSSGLGTSGGLQKFTNYALTSYWQSITSTPNFPPGKKGKITEVKVTFAGACSGGRTLELALKTNSGATTTTVFTGLGTLTASTLVKKYVAASSGADFPTFDNIRAQLAWDTGSGATAAPAVEKIEVYYKTVDVK